MCTAHSLTSHMLSVKYLKQNYHLSICFWRASFALWLIFWQRFKSSPSYTYFLRRLQCEISTSLLLKVLRDYIMCLNGIFLIQLCVHLSLWTRLSLMKCHPKFLRHNPTPLKRIYMEFNATKVNFQWNFHGLRHFIPIK